MDVARSGRVIDVPELTGLELEDDSGRVGNLVVDDAEAPVTAFVDSFHWRADVSKCFGCSGYDPSGLAEGQITLALKNPLIRPRLRAATEPQQAARQRTPSETFEAFIYVRWPESA